MVKLLVEHVGKVGNQPNDQCEAKAATKERLESFFPLVLELHGRAKEVTTSYGLTKHVAQFRHRFTFS